MLTSKTFLRSFVLLAFALPVSAFAAGTLTGTVTNLTTNKPSNGDEVALLSMSQGMTEVGTTKTDSKGHFTLALPDDGMHLVRVSHDKTSYFKSVQPGMTTADITIYDSAPKVKGVATEADVMRFQTEPGGNNLTVVESIFIRNDSVPPMTQFSSNPFDFWLPAGADIQGSAALAPGSTMPVTAAPVPLAEKNHYSFLFPLRPGETRFQISYKVPYTGKLLITPRLTGPTDTFAIMLPKSMTFTPVNGAPYNPVTEETTAQTFVARTATPDKPMGFTLSGTGELPRETDAPASAGQADQQAAPAGAAADNRPGGGMSTPVDPEGTRDPWAKYKYWILGGLALLLAAAAGVLLRKPSTTSPLAPVAHLPAQPLSPQVQHSPVLQTLKEEMFALETDRLQNRIPEAEYLEQKAALEAVLRRALSRNEPKPPTTA